MKNIHIIAPLVLLAPAALGGCLAMTAVGVAGKVVGTTVDVATGVIGAAIPDGDDDDKDKKKDDEKSR